MPKLNGTGPEGDGSRSGRKLGKCSETAEEEKLNKLGKGLGKKRHAGGGEGRGKRLKSNEK